MAALIETQALDVARAFSSGVPVSGDRISILSDEVLDVRFILTHDTNTFPIRAPYPRFGVFDLKGAQLLSLPFSPGVIGWEAEAPLSGRIGWRVDGDNPGFLAITTLHPQELRWRILGVFGGRTEITLAHGPFKYQRTSELPVSTPDSDDELASALEMFLQFKTQEPYFFTEYAWDVAGDIASKIHYEDPSKNVVLFYVTYTWGLDGLLERKVIRRASDNETLTLRYAWNPDETLRSVTRSRI